MRYNFRFIKFKGKMRSFFAKKLTFLSYSIVFGLKWGKKFNVAKNDRELWLDTCYDLLVEKFSDFIQNYKYESKSKINSNIIWVCWLQTDHIKPEVVEVCIKSIKKNAPSDCKVNVISMNNIAEYVELPSFIYKKLEKGNITLTHFSDILRMALLCKYGGLWIDSTVLTCGAIPSSYLNKSLYSIQAVNLDDGNNKKYYGPLASFLLGGSSDCMIFDFCYKFFLEYQKKYNLMVDGHWMNIIFRVIYEYFPYEIKEVNDIGINNGRYNVLVNYLNNPYDEYKWNELIDNQIFHKLNWRLDYHETVDGKLTYYGYIKRGLMNGKDN